ncbi:MAG: DUF2518 family protein [Cyanobium sp.]
MARNLRGNGRQSDDGMVRVRLRRVEAVEAGLSRPVVLAEARRDLLSGEISLQP